MKFTFRMFVGCMVVGSVIGLGLTWIGMERAGADPLTDTEQQYITDHGQAICDVFTAAPTMDTITGMGLELMYVHHFTSREASEVITYSITSQCPSEWPTMLKLTVGAAPSLGVPVSGVQHA